MIEYGAPWERQRNSQNLSYQVGTAKYVGYPDSTNTRKLGIPYDSEGVKERLVFHRKFRCGLYTSSIFGDNRPKNRCTIVHHIYLK